MTADTPDFAIQAARRISMEEPPFDPSTDDAGHNDWLAAIIREEHGRTLDSLTAQVASLTAQLRDTNAAAAANAQAVLAHDQEEQALVAELDVQAVTIAQLNEMNIALANKNARLATTVEALIADLYRLRAALEIIAGKRQPFDNLMGHADVARAALQEPPHG